jgi:hypothetical protein
MTKDSKYQGSAMGFTATVMKNHENPGPYNRTSMGFFAPLAGGPLSGFFNMIDKAPAIPIAKMTKLLAGAGLATAMFGAAVNPEATGRMAGEASAGFRAATMHQELCKEDCSGPRIAGEKIGGWAVKFEKGYNSRFTQ